MKRSIQTFLFVSCALAASGGPLLPPALPNVQAAATTKAKSPILVEDALDAFYYDLDRKSTTLIPPMGDEKPEVPAFPERDGLHAKIAARLARVDSLRQRGAAGENNRGFLEPRGTPSNVDQSTISDENADRLGIYEAIGTQTKTHVDDVGRTRAEKVRVMGKRGVWVQAPDGSWAQKV